MHKFLRQAACCKLQDTFYHCRCIGLLQPLDINDPFKQELKRVFSDWYAPKVSDQLKDNADTANLRIDLKTSTIVPIHANWHIHAVSRLSSQEDTLIHGW